MNEVDTVKVKMIKTEKVKVISNHHDWSKVYQTNSAGYLKKKIICR